VTGSLAGRMANAPIVGAVGGGGAPINSLK
jgi:hypothetical protein